MLMRHYLIIGFIFISSLFAAPDYNKEIGSFFFNDIYYFSISEFCDTQDYKYIYYEDKSKVAILFGNQKAIFTANSSFVQVGKQTVHLLNKMII